MSRRGDEVEADVDPGVVVVEQRALNLQLFLQVVFKLSVDVVHDGLVTVPEGQTQKGFHVFRLEQTHVSASMCGSLPRSQLEAAQLSVG